MIFWCFYIVLFLRQARCVQQADWVVVPVVVGAQWDGGGHHGHLWGHLVLQQGGGQRILGPLGMSASSGSVTLYYHPSGADFRTIRFSKYVYYDLHLDTRHSVTSYQVEYIIIIMPMIIIVYFIQDGTLN